MTRARPLPVPAAPEPEVGPARFTQPLLPLAMPASPMWVSSLEDPLRGTPYRFVRTLGTRGEMSELVLAEQTALGRRVVVELLGAKLAASEAFADRMRLKAQALAAISHPHVVTVLDAGKTPVGRSYLVMEKLVGRTLEEELCARGFLPVGEAIAWVRQLLAGLDAVHGAGLVHRDVKPANLFLYEATRGLRILKILDFGDAKFADQAAGPWTDVYAAGAVLYALVTGRHPFIHHRDLSSIQRAEDTPLRPSVGAPQAIPEALEHAMMKALAKRPGDRWGSASAFSEALEHALAERTVGGGTVVQPWARFRADADEPVSVRIRPAMQPDRFAVWRLAFRGSWRVMVALLVVAAVTAMIMGFAFLHHRRHPARPRLSSASPLAPG
jgi:eukaryotic-like serine/threonine-protein kinase